MRVIYIIQSLELGTEGCHQRVLASATLDKFAHPHQRFFDHEVGRDNAVFSIVNDTGVGFPQDSAKFGESRQVALNAFLIFDDMGVGQKLGQIDGDPRDLVHAVAAVAKLRLPQQIIEKPGSNFPCQQFLSFKPVRAIVI